MKKFNEFQKINEAKFDTLGSNIQKVYHMSNIYIILSNAGCIVDNQLVDVERANQIMRETKNYVVFHQRYTFDDFKKIFAELTAEVSDYL